MRSNERKVLINFIAGLTFAETNGDRYESAVEALSQINIKVPVLDDLHELANWLEENHDAETVWGTSINDKDFE